MQLLKTNTSPQNKCFIDLYRYLKIQFKILATNIIWDYSFVQVDR